MKKVLLLSLTLFYSALWAQTTSLAGKITDSETGEELIAANIIAYQNGVLKYGASTDFEGNYSMNLDPGTYDIDAAYIGFNTKRTTGVIVKSGHANKFDVALRGDSGGVDLDEIVVNEYKIQLIEQDNTTHGGPKTAAEIAKLPKRNIAALAASTAGLDAGGIKTAEEIAKLPTKKIGKLASSTAGLKQVKSSETCIVRGSRANATDVYVDGIRVSTTSAEPTSATKTTSTITEKLPKSGQLTAGEWKDLDNWSFWEKLMKNKQFADFQKFWGFYPEHRFELKLSDKNGRPLVNIKVNLLNAKEEVVWSSLSDNKGAACLWGNFNGGDDSEFQLEVLHPTGKEKIAAIPYSEGLNSLELETTCVGNKMIDVAFVVDVTGSMNDELRYLKSEISDVLDRAKTDEVNLEMRTGAVFYAGQRQRHVLKSSPLTEKHEETIHFMHTSPTAGGESYEAVDQGLGLAIRDLDWNPKAMARIAFILLDASPAHTDHVKENLHKMIKEGAEKGIKVIPVAASGTDKKTEFLLKFLAMGTNSTYTFLTNHSGIGGHHMAPQAGSYNVETLNDLLVRLIIENGEYHDCETTTTAIPEMLKTEKAYKEAKKRKEVKQLVKQINLFPNPARDYVNIDLEKAVDVLLISSMDGQVIAQYPKVEAGQIRIQTSDWAAGTYLLQFWTKEGHGVLKLVVSGDS